MRCLSRITVLGAAASIAGLISVLAVVGPDDAEGEARTSTTASAADRAELEWIGAASQGTPAQREPAHDLLERTEAGARVAAIRFLELTEDVVTLSPAEGAAMQRAIATERSADRLATEVEAQLTAIWVRVPEGVALHVAPLAVGSTEQGESWDVSIWYVEVSIYADQLAVEQWRTATYSLLWEDGEWRMDGLVSADGPVPTRPASVLSTPTVDLIAAVSALDDAVLTP